MTANYEQLPPSSTSARPEQDHLVPHAAHEMESELSLGELTARLSQQVSRMVREELALAQIQGKQRAKRAGVGAGLCGASVSIVRLAGRRQLWNTSR